MLFQHTIELILDMVLDAGNWRARRWLIAAVVFLITANLFFVLMTLSVLEQRLLKAAFLFLASAATLLCASMGLVRGIWLIADSEGVTLPPNAKWWALLGLAAVVVVPAPLLLLVALGLAILMWRRSKTRLAAKS